MPRAGASKIVKLSSPASNTRSARSKLASSSSISPSLQRMVDECANVMYAASANDVHDIMDNERDPSQNMYDENFAGQGQGNVNGASRTVEKGKGRAKEPARDCFPIMKLPPEIRLEIFRACLSRPRKLLLSRIEKAPESEAGSTTESGLGDLANGVTSPSRSGSRPAPSPCRSRTSTMRSSRPYRTAVPRSSSASMHSAAAALLSIQANPNAPNPQQSLALALPTTKKSHAHNAGPASDDALVINILRTSRQIYKEARDVLYSENTFDINIATAINTFLHLHQRSRRHIKHIELEIPTYTDILERFSDIVRLSLRYCTGLKTLVLHTPFTLPGHEGGISSATNTGVYANGFDILRWLPQQCEVGLKGHSNPDIDSVVTKHTNLAKTQDKMAYARRQLISNDHERLYYSG